MGSYTKSTSPRTALTVSKVKQALESVEQLASSPFALLDPLAFAVVGPS